MERGILGSLASFPSCMIVKKFSRINELHTKHFVGSVIPVWPFEVYDLFLIFT